MTVATRSCRGTRAARRASPGLAWFHQPASNLLLPDIGVSGNPGGARTRSNAVSVVSAQLRYLPASTVERARAVGRQVLDQFNRMEHMIKDRNLRQILRDKLPSVRLKFEPRDLWIGVYWNRPYWGLEVYICLIPCLPIRLTWYYEDQLPF